jgi:tripartite-type tricarboxylate transporter receptor subunit TctC
MSFQPRIRRFVLAVIIAAGALPPASAVAADPVADFYANRQLNMIVGAAAGGGYDLLARLTARHLNRHIPGNPAIVVQNMPAAGSLAATNYIANTAPRDGSVIALVQRGVLLIKLMNPSGVRFDLATLNWLGSLASETGVSLAWHTAKVKTIQDLFNEELIVGGVVNVDPETTPRLYNALIGTKFKIVLGYGGTPQVALAMERGEVQGTGDWSWSSLKKVRPEWLRDKKVNILLQGALEKDPELPDVPFALDFAKTEADRRVLQLFFTQKTVARPLIAPPGLPADRLAALRAAFAAMIKDPEFLADAQKSKLEVEPIPGEAVDKIVQLIAGTPPDVTARYTKALAK